MLSMHAPIAACVLLPACYLAPEVLEDRALDTEHAMRSTLWARWSDA